MERLTAKHYGEGRSYFMKCSKGCGANFIAGICEMDCKELDEIVDRLGQIEDILGDDYDLARLEVMMNQCMSMREEVSERFKITGGVSLDRLRELIMADSAGKIAILKYAPGQLVYRAYVKPDRSSAQIVIEKCKSVDDSLVLERTKDVYESMEEAVTALDKVMK